MDTNCFSINDLRVPSVYSVTQLLAAAYVSACKKLVSEGRQDPSLTRRGW